MTSSRPEMLKYCIHCKLSLPRSDFGANARRRDGLQQWCRPCRREYTSVGPQAAKSRERAREYYWSHPTSVAKLELRARERLERAEKKAREELERIAFKAAKKEESRIRAAAAAKERLAAQKEKRALERAAREAEKAANPPPPYSPPKEKVCTKCGVVKLLELFPPIPHTRDGRNSWCRDCCNALSRQRGRDPDRMEKRRQYKAAARRAAGVPPRPHDAHVAAYRAHLKELARQRRAEAVLHDAHVRAR